MQLTKNFSKKELQCPCCGKIEMNNELLQKLQSLRDEVGFSLTINSGFRCAKHNKEVGGSPNSQHLLGKAVDISIKGLNGEQRHLLLKSAFRLEFHGVGVYSNFLHLDLRKNPVFFTLK